MKRILSVTVMSAVVVALLAGPGLTAPKGVPGSPIGPNAIYADGELFGVIALKSLPFNDNEHAFDRLYMVPGQPAVAEAAPGRGYNGGRWLPVSVTWTDTPYLLTSEADVEAAEDAGDITLGTPMYDSAFLCPLIPNA